MEKINLIKREYVGEGYSDTIRNLKTGELITTLCELENYQDVEYPDIPEGFVYISSSGGFPMLDIGIGGLNDYFIRDGGYYVYELDPSLNNILTLNKYSKDEFNHKYTW